MNGPNRLDPVQLPHDPFRATPFNSQQHQATHRIGFGFFLQDHRKSDNIAALTQPFNPSPHRSARHSKLQRQIGKRRARIMAQSRYQLAIKIIHIGTFYIRFA